MRSIVRVTGFGCDMSKCSELHDPKAILAQRRPPLGWHKSCSEGSRASQREGSAVRPVFDLAIRALARLLLRVFYRRVEVVGLENIPASGPVLLVANHGNALVDPALVVAHSPRMPRFLAKHVLFRHPLVRPLLSSAGAIPVYRRQDGADPRANLDTFSRCYEELASGGVIALFP